MPRLLLALISIALLSGCAGTRSYEYKFVRGRTAILQDGVAVAPKRAPRAVKLAIAAANQIAGSPYRYGGGHGTSASSFDCSGATSYVLRSAGLMSGSMTSHGFRHYGRRGDGKWITVYATKGHVFLVIAGLRFDTGWHGGGKGPRWTTKSRPARRYVLRHPGGL